MSDQSPSNGSNPHPAQSDEILDAEIVDAEVVADEGSAFQPVGGESASETLKGTSPELSYEISQRPDFSLLTVNLDQGKRVLAEPSAMVSMSAGMLESRVSWWIGSKPWSNVWRRESHCQHIHRGVVTR